MYRMIGKNLNTDLAMPIMPKVFCLSSVVSLSRFAFLASCKKVVLQERLLSASVTRPVFELASSAVTGLGSFQVLSQETSVSSAPYYVSVAAGLPVSWVKVPGSPLLGDIAPGGSVSLVLLITPTEDLSGTYADGSLVALQSSNAATLAINGAITVTTTKKGAAVFTVVNGVSPVQHSGVARKSP